MQKSRKWPKDNTTLYNLEIHYIFLIKINSTIHGRYILYSSIQGGSKTRCFTRFLYREKSRDKSSRLAEVVDVGCLEIRRVLFTWFIN